MTDWTPIEDNTPNAFNERMAAYKQPFNWRGLIMLIFMALVVIGFAVGVWFMFLYSIHAYPVVIQTPVAEWTNTP